MKYSITIVILFWALLSAKSQDASIIATINYGQLEQCVQLAKEHYPRMKILELQEERAKSVRRAIPLTYLEGFNAFYFYRPEDRRAVNPENPYVFNGIQLGINFDLSTILQKPFLAKQAKADHKIAQYEIEAYDRLLETEVKARYYNYVMSMAELKTRNQDYQDAELMLSRSITIYENGELPIEQYNAIKMTTTSARSTLIQTEGAYLKAKDALEEMIGMDINEVK